MAIETGMPEVPHYAMASGCVLDQLSWQMSRSGLLTATTSLVAQGESVAMASNAGTPSDWTLKRFGHFNGQIKRGGTALGNVVSAQIAYASNLDRIETIRADGRIDGADPSIAALAGQIEVRFADRTLLDQAIDGTAAELSFGYTLGSGESFELVAPAVYLPRPRPSPRTTSPRGAGSRRSGRRGSRVGVYCSSSPVTGARESSSSSPFRSSGAGSVVSG